MPVSHNHPEAQCEPPVLSMNDEEHSQMESAEIDVLERHVVVIPAEHWDAFEVWAHKPATKIAALEYLARTPPKWKQWIDAPIFTLTLNSLSSKSNSTSSSGGASPNSTARLRKASLSRGAVMKDGSSPEKNARRQPGSKY
jgi:hypothetical protein